MVALAISITMAIVGTADYLGYIAHMDTGGKLKWTGLIILIIAVSAFITFGVDQSREASKRTNLSDEKSGSTRTEAQDWMKWYTYVAGSQARRLCCLTATMLIANAVLWPFWEDLRLPGVLIANAFITLLWKELTRQARKKLQSTDQTPG